MKKIAIIGTVGVPASYGGFETLAENIIGDNCSDEIEYTVFCSSKDNKEILSEYRGAKLKYIPLKANGMQSIIYDIISMIYALRGYDVVLVLGVSGGLFFPIFKLLSRSKFIVNIDGLEWKRAKWNLLAKIILRLSEELALRFADAVIADNQAIVDYIKGRYKKKTHLIAYGSDHVIRDISLQRENEILSKYSVQREGYAITICRIEPENNCHLILKVFSKSGLPIIFIGNWDKSDYGQELKAEYSKFSNIKIINALYDLDELYVLRSNSKFYIHGHSAGGTNPSLVEAMFCRCNILAYDVVYNRETTENTAFFFKDELELIILTLGENSSESNAEQMYCLAKNRYTWATIAKQYELLYD